MAMASSSVERYPVALLGSRRVSSRVSGRRLTRVIGTFRMIESNVKISDELWTTTFMGR
jgi:hypothetical protein